MARYEGFIGVSDKTQTIAANPERTKNWYYESQSKSAKNTAALLPTPGFRVLFNVNDIGGRALFTENGRTFGVMGSGYYELFGTASATKYATITQDNNQAQIVTNGAAGAQAFVASGTNGYVHDLVTNVVTQELTGTCLMIGMLDGYIVAFDPTTSKIFLSDLNDASTWDPLQFIQRNDASDNWKAMIVVSPDIWAVGEKTGSILYDAGTFPFPIAPRTGLSYKFGIIAGFTLKASGSSVLWLARNEDGAGIVVRTRGYSPVRVSDAAVENAISNYQRDSIITDAEGMVYQQDGHTFYVLSFPSVPATWAYDLDEDKWSERYYWNPAMNREELWKPRVHTYAFGQHLTADRTSGSICVMDVTIGTEADGTAITRDRIAPGIFNENQQVPIRVLEVYLESGLGTQTGQGVNPKVMWRTSDDGGKTYSNERLVEAGKVGEYGRRVRMWRMGVPRNRVNWMRVSDPIPWRIVDAFINNDN